MLEVFYEANSDEPTENQGSMHFKKDPIHSCCTHAFVKDMIPCLEWLLQTSIIVNIKIH